MTLKISVLIIASLISSCSATKDLFERVSIEDQEHNLTSAENGLTAVEMADRYKTLQKKNLKHIENDQTFIKDTEIQLKIRNLTMDLLANVDITEDTAIFINPITVINADSLPYAFERNQFINNLILKELLDYGIEVVDDSIFDTEKRMQKNLLILDTQVNKYQDLYYVNCFFKRPSNNQIYSTVKTEFQFLLLESSRDGVTLLN